MERIDWSKAPHWADRVVRSPRKRQLFWADDNQRNRFEDGYHGACNMHIRENWELVERRPEFAPKAFNPHHTHSIPSTIEQRIASLHALEKQVEETRAELTRDLEALGLTWTVRDEPSITDWRDLRVGDVIWVGSSSDESDAPCGEYCIVELDFEDSNQPVRVDWSGRESWPELASRGWRFIRRP